MTHLRKMMLEELERRNYSRGTIRYYLRFVERFSQHFGKPPDKLGPDHLRSYQAYLLRERKLCPGSVEHHVAALRFSSSARCTGMSSVSSFPTPRWAGSCPTFSAKKKSHG